MVVVSVGMFVRMAVLEILAADTEFRGCHSSSIHTLRPNRVGCDRQAAECSPHVVERHAGIEQCAENHVARNPRETVEIQNRHNVIILPCARLKSPRLQQ